MEILWSEAIELTTQGALFLFVIAVIAGFFDTLAGGGGLIVLPALITVGVPPLLALGTNKLQATAGTAMASSMMLLHAKVQYRLVWKLMVLSFIGSIIGAWSIQHVNAKVLSYAIPVVLVLIAMYFMLFPVLSRLSQQFTQSGSKRVYKLLVPCIGWYDGMFGPATGSFFTLAGVSLKKQGIIEATSMAKTLNFASNLASLLVFAWIGNIVWRIGLVMIVGQLIGAYLGSRCLFRIRSGYLRLLIVAISLVMLIQYCWSLEW